MLEFLFELSKIKKYKLSVHLIFPQLKQAPLHFFLLPLIFMGKYRPLFCLNSSFSHHYSIINRKSIDVVGILTQGSRIVGLEGHTKLWRYCNWFLTFVQTNHYMLLKCNGLMSLKIDKWTFKNRLSFSSGNNWEIGGIQNPLRSKHGKCQQQGRKEVGSFLVNTETNLKFNICDLRLIHMISIWRKRLLQTFPMKKIRKSPYSAQPQLSASNARHANHPIGKNGGTMVAQSSPRLKGFGFKSERKIPPHLDSTFRSRSHCSSRNSSIG